MAIPAPSDLSPEDDLRLNVLLANRPLAIRIDEGKLVVQGLHAQGESTIRLNPIGRPESYLRRVRERISGHVLGSPGGYPVYLRRWTRMGQMREESLEQLLLLGEPEAVVAVACSPGLNDELARRAWWVLEDAENARRMLGHPTVVQGQMGRRLAHYLLDYLPFESESETLMESVRLVLQTGLLDTERRTDLWKKAARKPAYLVGFLQALPDDLPVSAPARPLAAAIIRQADQGNSVVHLMQRLYSESGQTFLRTVAMVLDKPPSQDVVLKTFDCLRHYFSVLRPEGDPSLPLDDLVTDAIQFAAPDGAVPAVAVVLREAPELALEIAAMRLLSGVGYGLIRPILTDPTILGGLMRRKLEPILDPLRAHLDLLLGRPV